MPCYDPRFMFKPRDGGRYTFDSRKSDEPSVPVGCGRCEGCRARRTSQWRIRLMHEARYHDAVPLMITLTYANEFLPEDFSVSKLAVQLFVMRLRKRFGSGVRYYACGEYGSKDGGTKRPHYHLIVYGVTLDDLCDADMSQRGFVQYRSPSVEACWTDPKTGVLRGRVKVSFADGKAMGYVAGYVHKKLGAKPDDAKYVREHSVTGEVLRVRPEFALMSRRPGIGGAWFEQFGESDAQSDFVVVDGVKVGLPTYYRRRADELYKAARGAEALADRKADRAMASADKVAAQAADLTPERLAVRRELHVLRVASLARGGGE